MSFDPASVIIKFNPLSDDVFLHFNNDIFLPSELSSQIDYKAGGFVGFTRASKRRGRENELSSP